MTTIIGTLPFQLQNGTTADATQVMADFNKILTDVNANAAGNGVNTDITALTALITPITPAQGGTPVYFALTAGGTANAVTVASPTPTGFTLSVGKRVTFIAANTNTGAATLNVNSTGATAIRKNGHAGLEPLTGGEIAAGNTVEAIFDGTFFVLLDSPFSDVGPLTNLTSGAPDLGTISSHNVNITGTTTITSFGSSASVNEPVYFIRFNGILTLTYNATSLILPGAANITTAAGDWAIAQYSGSGNWVVLQYSRATGTAVVNPTPVGSAVGLVITNNAGTPNTQIDFTAAQITMINPTGNVPIYASGVSVTCNLTTGASGTSTANGMDGSARGTSAWIYLYLISNGSVAASLGSLSATTPTLPSGYLYYTRVGAMRVDGSGNLLRTRQVGNRAQYTVVSATNTAAMPNIGTGNSGSPTVPTWTSVAVSTFVPSTATAIRVVITITGSTGAITVAPNNQYGAVGSTTNPPPLYLNGGGATTYNAGLMGTLDLESANIYWANSAAANGSLWAQGWLDAVNAS